MFGFVPVPQPGVPAQGVPSNSSPIPHVMELSMPALGVRPVFERLEELEPRKAVAKNTLGEDAFAFLNPSHWGKRRLMMQIAGKAMAASLLVTTGLWIGSNVAKMEKRMIHREASAEIRKFEGSTKHPPGVPRPAGGVHSSGPLAWAHAIVARRAAIQVTDTFERGMEAWGATSKGGALGWERHPDGYVRPGRLALFQPSLNYTDYRLEFLGQIENQGLSWVVRAHDNQNYYAMQFHVLKAGLRPVISIVHYPVTGGKQGHRVEVPLSIMVHSQTAYQVSVQVKGNRFVASLEGQEVDSWTDDAPASGGVGFFADAGERARLYWMRVSRNDDWLGRICASLLGNSVEEPSQTALLGTTQPLPTHRPAPPETAILTGDTGKFSVACWLELQGASIHKSHRA